MKEYYFEIVEDIMGNGEELGFIIQGENVNEAYATFVNKFSVAYPNIGNVTIVHQEITWN